MDEQYDLFISYARADDHDGWVSGVVAAIQEEHARFTPTPLRLFFDKTAIRPWTGGSSASCAACGTAGSC